MSFAEEKAAMIGASRSLLRKRLREAISGLADWAWPAFKLPRFEFENKRLISSCGRYALQWKLRHRPDQPPSYHNLQTTCGIVVFVNLESPP